LNNKLVFIDIGDLIKLKNKVFHIDGFIDPGKIGLVIQSHKSKYFEQPTRPTAGMCLVTFANLDVWCYWEELEILNKYSDVK